MARTWRLTVSLENPGTKRVKKDRLEKGAADVQGQAKVRPFSTELLARLVSMWGLLDYP
jgi:hypothetical protein